MLSVWIATSKEQIKTPTAIALGNFDGIHQGHQIVLQPILKDLNPQLCSSVVSFNPHPKEFFTGKTIQLLTPVAEKVDLLTTLGIQQLVLLPFNQALASLSPVEFVEQVIVQQLQAQKISVGEDFCFGYQRQGTAQDLQTIAGKLGIEVQLNALHKTQDHHPAATRISSSLIRQSLLAGNINQANLMLGRPYTLIGEVVTGQQIGRTIGFPTANLQLPSEKFLPRYGVYAVEVSFERTAIKGVMNIGCRPTLQGQAPTVEVHLLNWTGDLYGEKITVKLEKFLRPEQKFPSLEALKQQITIDCQAALKV